MLIVPALAIGSVAHVAVSIIVPFLQKGVLVAVTADAVLAQHSINDVLAQASTQCPVGRAAVGVLGYA